MAQTREIIKERQVGYTPRGAAVTRVKTQVYSPEVEDAVTVWTVNRLIFYIAGVIEALLAFRFTLKILGANPGSPFVAFIYGLSAIFEAPFRGIFSTAVSPGIDRTVSIFEPSTLFALLVYLVLAIALTQLVNVLTASDA